MFITAVCVLFLIKLRWPRNKSLHDFFLEFHSSTEGVRSRIDQTKFWFDQRIYRFKSHFFRCPRPLNIGSFKKKCGNRIDVSWSSLGPPQIPRDTAGKSERSRETGNTCWNFQHGGQHQSDRCERKPQEVPSLWRFSWLLYTSTSFSQGPSRRADNRQRFKSSCFSRSVGFVRHRNGHLSVHKARVWCNASTQVKTCFVELVWFLDVQLWFFIALGDL